MKPTPRSILPRRRGWVLPTAFALLIVGFFATNLIALRSLQTFQAANRAIVESMVHRIDLAVRITHDFDTRRGLLTEHVLRRTSQEMRPLEQELASVDADLTAALHSYHALARDPAEHQALREIDVALASLVPHVSKLLELSRKNLDILAIDQLGLLEPQEDVIAKSMDTLVRVTRMDAARSIALIDARQRRVLVSGIVLTLLGTLLGLFIAVGMIRAAQRHDYSMRHAATLLEQSNRDLNDFAGRVAHDLRGPLTTISLSASLLSTRAPQEEGISKVLRRGVSQMESTIEDLLTLSRIDADPQSAAAAATEVMSTVADDLRQRVEAVGGVLHIAVAPATVRCSTGLLRQVLWNLADNSVKYRRTDVPLRIDIEGRVVGVSYQFRIADNGSGMSAEACRRAFEPFFRAEEVRTTPGTGLGLSIVRRIVESSGGAVSLSSQEGQGTTFLLSLPLAEPTR